MDIVKLKYFCTVCECKSVVSASKALHISQPSVSNAIKDLENEFSVLLFYRKHKGLVPTNEGKFFYEMGKDILMKIEKADRIMSDMGKSRTRLRLGVPPMIGSVILPRIYTEFKNVCPKTDIEIFEDGKNEIINMLENDEIDMAFMPHDINIENIYLSHYVTRIEIKCCVSKDNHISKLKEVRPGDLSGESLVLFKDGFFQTEEIKKWFTAENVKPEILVQTQQLSTMERIISENTAIGFGFWDMTSPKDRYVYVSALPKLYLDVSLVWKKDAYFLSSMKSFLDYISKNNIFNIKKEAF